MKFIFRFVLFCFWCFFSLSVCKFAVERRVLMNYANDRAKCVLISIIVKTISLSIHIWTSTSVKFFFPFRWTTKWCVENPFSSIEFYFGSFVYLSIGHKRRCAFNFDYHPKNMITLNLSNVSSTEWKLNNRIQQKIHSTQLNQRTVFDRTISMHVEWNEIKKNGATERKANTNWTATILYNNESNVIHQNSLSALL